MIFGQSLKELRNKRNLTQEELADKLEMDRSNVSNYERGTVLPPVDVLVKVADIFHVSTDYLLGRDGYSSAAEADVLRLQGTLDEIKKLVIR